MFKKTITYNEFHNDEIHELTEEIYFNHTLKTLKLYESEHDTYFYDDFQNALTEFSDIDLKKLKNNITENEDEEDELLDTSMFSMMACPQIMKFLEKSLPCLYAEAQQGALIQSEETFNNFIEAAYFAEFLSFEFFTEIMNLVLKMQSKAPKKPKKAGKSKK